MSMAKDFLAFLGLVFLTILIVIGVGLIAYLFDVFQLAPLPNDLTAWFRPETKVYIEATPVDVFKAIDPHDQPVLATLTPSRSISPTPGLTTSPISPLEPAIYQETIAERLKRFVTALENWRNLNNKLVKDRDLANDAAWIEEMKICLEVVVITGKGLADVGPPPGEYAAIDAWFNQIPPETEGLKYAYLAALNTGDPKSFLLASDHFARIKEILAGSVQDMIALGWYVE